MSRKTWIIVLVAAGVGMAILIGVLGSQGDSQANAQADFCSNVSSLKGSINDLTSLSPSTASKSDYQSDVSAIEDDWSSVKSSASNLTNATTSDLEDSWNSFKSAVDDVPSDASVSDALNDVSSSAKTFASSAKSTLTGPQCS